MRKPSTPIDLVAVMALVIATVVSTNTVASADDEPNLLLRAESLTVLPKSKPMLYVQVANPSQRSVKATISIKVPDSWRVAQLSHSVELAGGEHRRLGFSVAEGDEDKNNLYPIEITAESNGRSVVRRQIISVASAPYFKPTIDGDPSDWQDAIPVSFAQGGKKTSIATYWNRRQFSLLLSVEEAKLIPHAGAEPFDAVQIVLAPSNSKTAHSTGEEANRFEYLVYSDAAGDGRCCQLVVPGMKLTETTRPRSLDPLAYDQAQIAVRRVGQVTTYELSLPLTSIRSHIRPSEGREFFLSVLVHDPDGTGVRDWGVAAGLWERQRNRLAWSEWEGTQWGATPPMDCRTQWGMCSSRY